MKEIYSGFIRLHILHHASHEPIFGVGIIEELKRHGYTLSPGTLYPILHALEKNGLLKSTQKTDGRTKRRWYRATVKGRKELQSSKAKIKELFDELFDADEH